MPLCRMFLYPDDLPFRLLRKSTTYFGCSPRRCFAASSSQLRLNEKKNTAVEAISRTIQSAQSDSHIVRLLVGTQLGGSDVSHRIFQNFPADERLFSACQFKPVSKWALDLLLKQFASHEADSMAAFFYRRVSVIRGAESFRGGWFERQIFH